MKFRKDWAVKIAVVVIGVGIVSAANATTIKQSLYSLPQSPALTAPAGYLQVASDPQVSIVSGDAVNQLIQACWQLDQAAVDQWTKATGLSRDDLLKMEQAWMQGVMQQNADITVGDAYKLQQAWMANFLSSSQPQQNSNVQAADAQQAVSSQAALQPQVSLPAQPPQGSYQQPQTNPKYYGGSGQPQGNYRNYNGYNNWNCQWDNGRGNWW